MEAPTCSIVIPVYKNAGSIAELVARLDGIATELGGDLEVVFVIDGSPDDSAALLRSAIANAAFAAQLIEHSRNFGSFAAIRTGLAAAKGEYISVMAADLQEPAELTVQFFEALKSGDVDVVVGARTGRDDPGFSRGSSNLFWSLYRRTVNPEFPVGGVDIFGCTRTVADEIGKLTESHSSLVGLLYWVGFRRASIPYERQARGSGKSGWTFSKKVRYLFDSVFAFTDLPLIVLVATGMIGAAITIILSLVVFISYLAGTIKEPGYTPIVLVILFSTFTILTALGIVGAYVWRTYENSKARPSAIVMRSWSSDDRGR